MRAAPETSSVRHDIFHHSWESKLSIVMIFMESVPRFPKEFPELLVVDNLVD